MRGVGIVRHLSISKKIGVLVSIAVIFLGLVGIAAYYYVDKAGRTIETMYEDRLLPVQWLNECRVYQRAIEADVLEIIITTDANEQERLKSDIKKRAASFTEAINKCKESNLESADKAKLDDIMTMVKKYRDYRQQSIDLASAGKQVEAYALYVKIVKPLSDEINNKEIEVAVSAEKKAEAAAAGSREDIKTTIKVLLSLICLALILIAIIGLWIKNMITRPLTVVVDAVKEIATGNLALSALNIDNKDELGQVASAINTMLKNLQLLIGQVNDSTQQVVAFSEELTANAEQSAKASDQVAQTIIKVAAGADRQLISVNESAVVIDKMTDGINSSVENVTLVRDLADKTADASKEGSKSIDNTVKQMNIIEKAVTGSAEIVIELGERSKEIGQIVDTMSGIAGQTNLLALNAAIEAARAGEQGKGFAVVAEEVRKLAEQSQEAAKQVADLIQQIQGSTENAVVAMNEGTHEVKIGTEVVASAGISFEQIAELIAEMSSQSQKTIDVINTLEEGSRQIVNFTQNITLVSQQTSEQTQTVSAATEEQSASIEEIAASTRKLAQMAEGLQAIICKFKI